MKHGNVNSPFSCGYRGAPSLNLFPQSPKLPGRDSPAPSCKGEVLLRRQSQLQAEAKIALAQVSDL